MDCFNSPPNHPSGRGRKPPSQEYARLEQIVDKTEEKRCFCPNCAPQNSPVFPACSFAATAVAFSQRWTFWLIVKVPRKQLRALRRCEGREVARVARGEWREASGEWREARGEWRVANGEWRVASGEWRVASGEWRVASGEWRVGPALGIGSVRGFSVERLPVSFALLTLASGVVSLGSGNLQSG